jgi:amino acid transporter
VLWSLPTAYMIGELAGALPEEGGFYVWVRRALGPCWGFQEAWLSLVASIFDMAIYPALFLEYLRRLFPYFGIGHRGVLVGLTIVTVCALLNIAGVRLVALTSLWLFVLLSMPFAILMLVALWKHGMFTGQTAPTTTHVGMITGILAAMWNYMGWDNASTIAAEVDNPQKTYSRAMLITVGIVALSYILPVAAMSITGIRPSAFETGSWADLAAQVVGPWLRVVLVVGGMLSAFGMFNSLVMSYSRLPLAMAQDGMLPGVFGKLHPKTKAPWVAILTLAAGWALCLGLSFERLLTIDILIYGLSLLLEFAALAALRLREPDLPRPFRVPGGTFGAFAVGVFPMLLLGFSVVQSHSERIAGMNALLFGCLLIAAGFVVYFLRSAMISSAKSPEPEAFS